MIYFCPCDYIKLKVYVIPDTVELRWFEVEGPMKNCSSFPWLDPSTAAVLNYQFVLHDYCYLDSSIFFNLIKELLLEQHH